jgi:hypothetical protein
MDREQAAAKINDNLKSSGYLFEGDGWSFHCNDIHMEITEAGRRRCGYSSSFRTPDYTSVDIALTTHTYPRIRRGFKNFHVVTGDYHTLVLKLEELACLLDKSRNAVREKQKKAATRFMGMYKDFEQYGFKPDICGCATGKMPTPKDTPDWTGATMKLKLAELEISIDWYNEGKARASIKGDMSPEKIIPIIKALQILDNK